MFEKFLNEYAKNVRHINEKMAPVEQLSVLLREGIDYMWLAGEKVRVSKEDAKLILSYYNEADRNARRHIEEEISTGEGLTRFVALRRKLVREQTAAQDKLLAEGVSAMFELVRNLRYVPGLEKVLSVNNTIDGMEATVQAVDGAKYHVRVTPMGEAMMEDFYDRAWYNDYKEWNRARQSLDTDDDDQFSSRLGGKTIARWNEEDGEGWLRADVMLEGWGDPPRRGRRLKTGSINTPLIGRRVVMRRQPQDEGVVTHVDREPTFSQMVPYILIYTIELDNGDMLGARREEFKVRKEQPVAEGMPEGSLEDFLDPFKRRAMNTGTPPSNEELIKHHRDQIAKLGPNAYKSHIAYHEKEIRKLQRPVAEDASLARTGDGRKKEAIHAMRKAAVTMVSMGVGRNEDKARQHIQTIGLNYGLKPDEAVELARKILAKEMGLRRDYLNR